MKPVEFYAVADPVIVRYNLELVALDNPSGAVWGWGGFVYAEDATGEIASTHVCTLSSRESALSAAQYTATALTARLNRGQLPVGFSSWKRSSQRYDADFYDELETA